MKENPKGSIVPVRGYLLEEVFHDPEDHQGDQQSESSHHGRHDEAASRHQEDAHHGPCGQDHHGRQKSIIDDHFRKAGEAHGAIVEEIEEEIELVHGGLLGSIKGKDNG